MRTVVLRILAITHGLWHGGAQEAVLEMIKLLKGSDVDVAVITCEHRDSWFLSEAKKIGVPTFSAPYEMVARYPDIAVEGLSGLVESSDLVWISDVEYLVAPRVKRIRRDIPVVAWLHSFAILCPWWGALYGFQETCRQRCSLRRIIRCKQLSNEYLHRCQALGGSRMRLYQLLDLVKGPLDFERWPMSTDVLENIDGFAAVSKSVKELTLIHLPQLRGAPFEVVDNPFIVPALETHKENRKDGPAMLYASGANIVKGPHIALSAAKQLLDQGFKDLTLTMPRVKGNPWIENLVRKLDMERHVRLLPMLKLEEVYALMSRSNLVLMPSLWPEAFGRIPVEANQLGTPAIVSDRGALPEVVVDHVTGLVGEPSVESFAGMMAEALGMEWKRELIIRTARTRFNPKHVVKDFIRFLSRFT